MGRTIKTETQLGSDYQNKTGVVGQRIYDPLGRVKFEADPFLSTDSFETAYGTTYNYNTDGTPSCFVRGPGTQPVTFSVNETTEVYPTCFNHGFLNSQEFQDRGESNSFLAGSNQAFNFTRTMLNATGRVLERGTLHNTGTSFTVLDKAVFTYDALGHRTGMTRYKDPANKLGAVTTRWHYDSLGRVTKLEEDGVAARTRTYDFFGNLTVEQWCNDSNLGALPKRRPPHHRPL